MKPAAPVIENRLVEGDRQAIAQGLSDLFVELEVQVGRHNKGAKLWATTRVFGDLELLQTNVVKGGFSVIRSPELVARSVSNSFLIACIFDGEVTFT